MENKMIKNDVVDIMDIGFIAPDEIKFYQTPGGFVCCCINGKDYKRVILARTMPYLCPDGYISIMDSEQKEIGMIKDIYSLDNESSGIVKDELARRYYCNKIKQINSAKEKMGYVYFEVVTEYGEKIFAVKDVSRNIRKLDKTDKILFLDVDGNRYVIEKFAELDKKSFRLLSPYMF